MKIIAGLGNPGLRYRNTRHNVGFTVIAVLAKKYHIGLKKKGFGGLYGIGGILGEETILFQPMTYMNRSGEALKSIVIPKLDDKKDLLVISDDINLALGSLRIRANGSSGGHNGLKSIIEHMGDDFTRLRVGVASGPLPAETSSYVLSRFSRREKDLIGGAIERSVECTEKWLTKGVEEAMRLYNNSNNSH